MRSESSNCIFCKIVRKEAAAHAVCEDERTLVFMDIFPVSDGHSLIIPKAHCDDIFSADPEDLRAVIDRARQVALAIGRVLAPDGLGIYQLNGAAAGQTVPHYHMHLIPRNHGRGLQVPTRVPGDPVRLAEIAKRLGEAVATG